MGMAVVRKPRAAETKVMTGRANVFGTILRESGEIVPGAERGKGGLP